MAFQGVSFYVSFLPKTFSFGPKRFICVSFAIGVYNELLFLFYLPSNMI